MAEPIVLLPVSLFEKEDEQKTKENIRQAIEPKMLFSYLLDYDRGHCGCT